MSGLRIWQVDAFTDKPFAGNPAAVCLLDVERDSAWMQSVAAEMNLSETAFVRPLVDGFSLRWFTPTVEVPLCGHATLASAHALWSAGVARPDEPIHFHSQSGLLTATRREPLIELDFPATPAEECPPPASLLAALGNFEPTVFGKTSLNTYLVVTTAAQVRALAPDYPALAKVARGVIVTAASDDPRFDFISRYFAPAAGINEDPVTGSAHCALGPYWSERLGKQELVGYQASQRGGIVHVRPTANRVNFAGQAVTVLQGELMETHAR